MLATGTVARGELKVAVGLVDDDTVVAAAAGLVSCATVRGACAGVDDEAPASTGEEGAVSVKNGKVRLSGREAAAPEEGERGTTAGVPTIEYEAGGNSGAGGGGRSANSALIVPLSECADSVPSDAMRDNVVSTMPLQHSLPHDS